MDNNKQAIMIKGTRDGLTLFINDRYSFKTIKNELQSFTNYSLKEKEQNVSITVHLGKRYISDSEQEKIKHIIESQSNLLVKTFQSDVILKSKAKKLLAENKTKIVHKIVRSGQVLDQTGNLLLVGDVNPGGTIRATGNIYVMGNLLGIAHAGSKGDHNAFIVASYMKPSQLRIGDYISRAPDYESAGVYMECGLIDEKENRIILNRLQTLSHIANDLSGFERRIENG